MLQLKKKKYGDEDNGLKPIKGCIARIISEEKSEKVKQIQRPCKENIRLGIKRQNGLDEAQKKKRRKKGSVYVNIQNSTITTASHNVINPNAMDRIRAAVATVQGIANIDLEQLLNAISGNINEV